MLLASRHTTRAILGTRTNDRVVSARWLSINIHLHGADTDDEFEKLQPTHVGYI